MHPHDGGSHRAKLDDDDFNIISEESLARDTDRQADIRTYERTDRQAGRQTDRQTRVVYGKVCKVAYDVANKNVGTSKNK